MNWTITVPRSRCLAASTLLVATAVWAQVPEISELEVVQSDFPEMAVELEVVGPSGELVDTLGAADVVVIEDGRRVEGTLTSGPSPEGIAYVFVVDTSGSMARLLPDVERALAGFVADLGAADKAALVSFNDDVDVISDFTADREDLRSRIAELEPGGLYTQLYYAVHEAIGLFRTPGLSQRKVAFVISDGRDEGKSYTLDDVIGQATSMGVEIMGLAVESIDPRDLLNVERMARKTGGVYVKVGEGQDWIEKLGLLRRSIDARWRFAWTSTLPADGDTHEVLLEVALGELALTRPLTVSTLLVASEPAEGEAAPGPDYRLWGAIAAGAIFLAAVALLLVMRSRRRRAEELAKVEERLEEEREHQARTEGELKQAVVAATAKLEQLEQAKPEAPPERKQKRRTLFQPGAASEAAPVTYRSASLVVETGPLAGSTLPLLDGDTTLGRGDENNVVLDEERVSHRHAVIRKQDGAYWLEDLGSTNGTFVGDLPVSGRYALQSGDRVRVGGAALLFRGED